MKDIARPTVSIIIASRNRCSQLDNCVASILDSTCSAWELIVVEQTPACHHQFVDDPRVTHIRTETVGKTVAINIGVSASSGAILAFTDDDCTVTSCWISDCITAATKADVIFGSLVAYKQDFGIEYVPTFEPKQERILSGRLAFLKNGGAGANLIMHRSVYDRVGPFDEHLGPGRPLRSLEEFDYMYRALRIGAKIMYSPAVEVCHWGGRPWATGAGAALARDYRFGEGAVLAKHLKCGDPQPMVMVGSIVASEVARCVRSLLRTGRPTGAGRLAAFLHGLGSGLTAGVDRPRRLYRSTN